jgi:hypothetical protein
MALGTKRLGKPSSAVRAASVGKWTNWKVQNANTLRTLGDLILRGVLWAQSISVTSPILRIAMYGDWLQSSATFYINLCDLVTELLVTSDDRRY